MGGGRWRSVEVGGGVVGGGGWRLAHSIVTPIFYAFLSRDDDNPRRVN